MAIHSAGEVNVMCGRVFQSLSVNGRILMYGSPRLMAMGIWYPSTVVMLGTSLLILGDLSLMMHPKLSSCPADRIVFESLVMSAAWCSTMMILPSCVRTTPPAVTRVRFRTVWSSIPLRSIVLSVLAITRISLPAMHPFAPRSTSVDQSTRGFLPLLVLVDAMKTDKECWSLSAEGGTIVG